MSGGATLFSPGLNNGMWSGSLANQGGFDLGIEAAGFPQTGGDNSGITAAGSGGGYSAREASTKFIESTLNWLKGSHSISTGFNYTQADVWLLTETRAALDRLQPAHRRPRPRDVQRGELREQQQRAAERGAGPVRGADRPHQLDQRHGASGPEHRPVRLQRPEPPGRPAARGRPLHPGQLEDASEPVVERRPAVRDAAAVLREVRHVLDGHAQ